MGRLTSGQLARKAKVNSETVRYYERKGLIPKPPRGSSGYRQYSEDTIARIEFIKRAKALGFSLDEVSELLSLRVDPNTTCNDVKRKAMTKIANIEEKIRGLAEMWNALMSLAAACVGSGPTSECPILEALDAEEKRC